ncbi:MAG: SH3 domain-containing C40 family peptidase [Bacteroidota bacterium]
MTGCTIQTKHTDTEKVQILLDSIKSVYAPDTRIALWDISIDRSSDTIRIIGELDKTESFDAIDAVIIKEYPHIENHISLLPEEDIDQIVTGLINNSVANLRSKPKHSSEIVTQALLGTPVRILKRKNDWYLIQTPNKYIAWVDAPAITKIGKQELSAYKQSEKIIFNKQYGFSYTQADDKSQRVSDLVVGCILPIISTDKGFYQVQYPDKRVAWVKIAETIDANIIFNMLLVEEALVSTAQKFVGIPYLWGGTSSKAIDCSGFTSTIYYMNGIILQRDASQQTKYGKEITSTYECTDLLPGDLLFFGRKASDSLPERVTHVAMYIGKTEFIHASGKVRINSIDSTRDNFIAEYVPRFVRASRVKGEIDGSGIENFAENKFYKEIINDKE